jgi:hypothetical protein
VRIIKYNKKTDQYTTESGHKIKVFDENPEVHPVALNNPRNGYDYAEPGEPFYCRWAGAAVDEKGRLWRVGWVFEIVRREDDDEDDCPPEYSHEADYMPWDDLTRMFAYPTDVDDDDWTPEEAMKIADMPEELND